MNMSMNATQIRSRFRSLITTDQCLFPASVFDPLSVRMAHGLGYEMGMMAGSTTSLSVLGAPDLVLLTLSELTDQATRLCRSAPLPIMVDADHGYGNALNAMRSVEELDRAGVAAITIEDTLLPTPFNETRGKGLISVEEGVGKIRASLGARRDPGLLIVARTSAIVIAGLEEAIDRAKAYEEAGADAMFVAGVKSRDQLDAISASVKIPLFLGTANASLREPAYLISRNVRVFFEGHQPYYAAVLAAYEALKALRDGTPPSDIVVAPAELVRKLTNQDVYDTWKNEFLK